MAAYYNEIDPYAAQWLRNLISAGHIAPGDVDERSIVDVRPDDLRGYTQAHFFAGIGGWSVALRLAAWPDDRPVWTGSCPCQPFSAAGAGKAADDERHLWPSWFPLIAECRPAIVFGEQVEAAIGWGWLDVVFADLEGEGYACGTAVLPACGVGAPHIRQRSWFVAHADGGDASAEGLQRSGEHRQRAQDGRPGGGLADSEGNGRREGSQVASRGDEGTEPQGSGIGLADDSGSGSVAHTSGIGREWRKAPSGGNVDDRTAPERQQDQHGVGIASSHWRCEWLPCTDGKARPVEPGTFPLAHGVSARTSKLRAYGNAIIPQVAAEFIKATIDQ